MAPAYNFETLFNFSASPVTSMSFSHNQWWLLMGDDDGTLRYLHSYDEIMKGKGVAAQLRCCPLTPLTCACCSALARRQRHFVFTDGRKVCDVQ